MMSTRLSALTLGAMAILAVATPLEGRTDGGSGSCSTGPLECCNSVTQVEIPSPSLQKAAFLMSVQANSASGSLILGLLGLVVSDPNSLIGMNCSPLIVTGVGDGNTCNGQTVCCTNNNVGGLISVGCIPISL
ncbi:hydrophobin [Trametes polyzona]|nr:hydrophobin [Trametes polyzona]